MGITIGWDFFSFFFFGSDFVEKKGGGGNCASGMGYCVALGGRGCILVGHGGGWWDRRYNMV